MVGIRTTEEPAYEVLVSEGDFELRAYDTAVIATTLVTGTDYDDSGSKGFRRLGGYIFGDNRKAGTDESEKIAMTAPVLQTKTDAGWTMAFVMPSKHSYESMPEPTDRSVELQQVPARRVVSVRYSGGVSEKTIRKHAAKLRSWAESQGLEVASAPRSARYDPPWTLPFFRLNEVHLDVR